jgi:hypothetical protein
MAGMTPFTIEAEVSCTDGFCGTLSRVVVDRRGRTVTHLVVNDRQLQGRLVPLDLVDVDAATGKIRLRCPTAVPTARRRRHDVVAARQRRGQENSGQLFRRHQCGGRGKCGAGRKSGCLTALPQVRVRSLQAAADPVLNQWPERLSITLTRTVTCQAVLPLRAPPAGPRQALR